MNGIYLYFVNKHRSRWPLLELWIQNLTTVFGRILFSSVVMVLALRPGVPGSNPVRTLYFCHAFIHLFLYYGICSQFIFKEAYIPCYCSLAFVRDESIQQWLCVLELWYQTKVFFLNSLSNMPILGSSNSAANKDMMAKIWTNGDTITC